MFKTFLGAAAVGLGICIVAGTVIGVTANVAKQIYDKQRERYLANKESKEPKNE